MYIEKITENKNKKYKEYNFLYTLFPSILLYMQAHGNISELITENVTEGKNNKNLK